MREGGGKLRQQMRNKGEARCGLNTMRDVGIQQVQVQQREGENEVIRH